MAKQTVQRRIFIFNAMLVLVTLIIFLLINAAVIKLYTESIEGELKTSMAAITNEEDFEDMINNFTVRRDEFILLFLADGVLMIGGLVFVSRFFTKYLVNDIMKPLNALAEGAERIRSHDLTTDIEYSGEAEFENVCQTFNDMRKAILTEQEKNRKYEKARTDMIVGISHDLRTPLTAIRGTIKGLLDGVAATPESRQKFLETAYRRTEDMDILLNQLFYLSKLETGNMPLNLTSVEIADFIQKYVNGKREILKNEPVEITADLKGTVGYASVDPEQLQRIFDNLLENSKKYGETEPLKIKITLETTKDGFRIGFADNGVGIPEEKLPYIFDEFYRGDESRHKKDGNGLGLYIVKHLTESMGGSVRAENADGLVIYLELKEAKEA